VGIISLIDEVSEKSTLIDSAQCINEAILYRKVMIKFISVNTFLDVCVNPILYRPSVNIHFSVQIITYLGVSTVEVTDDIRHTYTPETIFVAEYA
jgi:hypothetical protein